MKVIKIDDALYFDDGTVLSSYHNQYCCESHDLYFGDLTLADFDGLEFDLTNDNFFTRIDGFGIALNPIHGHPIRIPGHGSNNGYYSSNMSLCLTGTIEKSYDISECQEISD